MVFLDLKVVTKVIWKYDVGKEINTTVKLLVVKIFWFKLFF